MSSLWQNVKLKISLFYNFLLTIYEKSNNVYNSFFKKKRFKPESLTHHENVCKNNPSLFQKKAKAK